MQKRDDFSDVKSRGIEMIPGKTTFDKTKVVMEEKPQPPEPEPVVELKLKDSLPVIKEQLARNILDLLNGKSNAQIITGTIITIISFLLLLLLTKC